VAVVLMLVGIGLIGVLTATVASYFVGEQADRDKDDLIARLNRIEAMLEQALGQANGQVQSTATPDRSGASASDATAPHP